MAKIPLTLTCGGTKELEKFRLFVDFEFWTEMSSRGTNNSNPVWLRKIQTELSDAGYCNYSQSQGSSLLIFSSFGPVLSAPKEQQLSTGNFAGRTASTENQPPSSCNLTRSDRCRKNVCFLRQLGTFLLKSSLTSFQSRILAMSEGQSF